jgi:Heparinase II/III-like protein
MFEFMLTYTRPDGTFPQIGDNDDGRLVNLDDEPVGSHCRHLGVGGVMFERPDMLGAAGNAVETAAWLCGPRALDLPREQSEPTSQAFPDGGFYVMRASDVVMTIDAGEIGMRGIGGHGHNDVLSFDLWAAGAPLLVDSGTYTYTADPAARQLLRSTQSHNALRVDGQETSRLGADRWLWLIENDAHPKDVNWQSNAQRDVFSAAHDGYRRLAEPVEHTRSISFDKHRMWWTIKDIVTGIGSHEAELFFHPGVAFDLEGDVVRLHAPRADLLVFPPAETTLTRQAGWISRGYGLREPAVVLVYAVRAAVPFVLRTDLVLVPRGTPTTVARSMCSHD